jgi:hypothetical protein
MAFQVEHGRYGPTSLDGLGFIVLGFTPKEMASGNWSVGLISDERASAEQRDALTAIVSGFRRRPDGSAVRTDRKVSWRGIRLDPL